MTNDEQMPELHRLKIDPRPMDDLLSGAKTGEVRKDDRVFRVGDHVLLTCADGREAGYEISHIQRGYSLPDGLCVLSYRADLCASGQQVRALALLEAARFIETMEQVVPPEPMTAEMLKAVAGAGLRYMAKRLAPLTPAPQPEGMECPRCASVGGFGCYECTPPQPSEMIAAIRINPDQIEAFERETGGKLRRPSRLVLN